MKFHRSLKWKINFFKQTLGGIWYRGLFVVISIVLEFIGFIITVVGLTITIAYLYRPSLLESFGPENYAEELNKDRMQNRSDCLLRSRNFLLGGCVLEIQASLLMLLVGIIMCFDYKSIYSTWFVVSVPITSIIFILKTILLVIFAIRRWQKGLLFVSSFFLFKKKKFKSTTFFYIWIDFFFGILFYWLFFINIFYL